MEKRTQTSTGIPLDQPRDVAQRVADSFEAVTSASQTQAKTRTFYEAALNQILMAAGIEIEDKLKDVTWSEFYEEWKGKKSYYWTNSSWLKYTGQYKRFLQYLEDRGLEEASLRAISTHVYQDYIEELSLKYSPGTVAGHYATLRSAESLARKLGYINRQEFPLVSLPASKQENARRPFTRDEFKLLVKYAKGTEWEIPVMLGSLLGLRISDACNMSYAHIKEAAGNLFFLFKPAKKSTSIRLPVPDQLRPLLKFQLQGPLCPELSKLTTSSLSSRFGSFLDSIPGIQRNAVRAGVRMQYDLSFHSLRYFSKSMHDESGVPAGVSNQINNHEDARVADGYSVASLAAMKDAIQSSTGKIYDEIA